MLVIILSIFYLFMFVLTGAFLCDYLEDPGELSGLGATFWPITWIIIAIDLLYKRGGKISNGIKLFFKYLTYPVWKPFVIIADFGEYLGNKLKN